MLEQADSLRAAGSGIGLWTNAFRVLDVLGVGEQLRAMFINLDKYVIRFMPNFAISIISRIAK